MGVLLSRFRAKPSTKELLEEIQKEIDSHLEYKHTTELQQKNLIGSLIFYSVLFYIIFFSIFLYYSYPLTNKSNIIYAIPFLVFPILLYIFKRFLQWYFAQKIRRNEENLFQLRKRKKSLLEFAMETETYKIVKELLEKFDPEYQKKIFEPKPAIEASPAGLKGSFTDMDLRRRNVAQRLQSSPVAISSNSGPTLKMNSSTGSPNIFPVFQSRPPTNQPYPPAFYQRGGPRFVRPPLQQMPRPVLPRDRSLMDRLVDYLVGDGPSNRYALICRFCQSHNGMALKEEFEYVAFRCCYCFQFNPPRNQQPPPPRLTLPAATAPPAITDGISSAVSSSSEDTDVDNTNENDSSPIITPQENSSVDDSKELSSQRLSISSDTSEIQANLVEDKPYVPPESNEETDMQNEEINEEKS